MRPKDRNIMGLPMELCRPNGARYVIRLTHRVTHTPALKWQSQSAASACADIWISRVRNQMSNSLTLYRQRKKNWQLDHAAAVRSACRTMPWWGCACSCFVWSTAVMRTFFFRCRCRWKVGEIDFRNNPEFRIHGDWHMPDWLLRHLPTPAKQCSYPVHRTVKWW